MSKWRSSTKIEALVEELFKLQKQDATIKSIVFSQFVSFLDLIHWRLNRAGFNCVKLDGRMSPIQRDAVIQHFMTDPTVTVFLVSLKAGGIALNLTEASQCFMMDLFVPLFGSKLMALTLTRWWNPACEFQAFDRIHRFGQHRPVKITRFVIEVWAFLPDPLFPFAPLTKDVRSRIPSRVVSSNFKRRKRFFLIQRSVRIWTRCRG